MDFYALFRFDDVWDATLDWQTMSSSYGPSLENRGELPGETFSIIGMDPPAHTKLRNVISRGFTPRRMAALEDQIRALAREYLEPLGKERAFDFEQAFAVRYPMDVISVLLGIPKEMRDQYREWVDKGLERDPEGGLAKEAPFHLGSSREYVSGLINERRKQPREDLITVLAEAEFEDVDGRSRRLTHDECSSFTTLLAAAGAETTAKLLGSRRVSALAASRPTPITLGRSLPDPERDRRDPPLRGPLPVPGSRGASGVDLARP